MSYVDGEGYKEITAAVAFRSHNTSFDCAVMVLKIEDLLEAKTRIPPSKMS